jgi:hypothetical protein
MRRLLFEPLQPGGPLPSPSVNNSPWPSGQENIHRLMGPVFEPIMQNNFLFSEEYRYCKAYGVFTLKLQREKSVLI